MYVHNELLRRVIDAIDSIDLSHPSIDTDAPSEIAVVTRTVRQWKELRDAGRALSAYLAKQEEGRG